jgi:serine protease AprX
MEDDAVKLARKQVLVVAVLLSLCAVSSRASQEKIDPWLARELATKGEAEFLVVLRAQADTSAAQALPAKEAKGTWVMETLRAVAEATQPPVRKLLQELGVPFRAYWIVNMFWVKGNEATAKALAALPDVAAILPNPRVRLERPQAEESALAPEAIEWGITKTGAPSVWALGFRGQGVVVAGQDTGYQWDHPALKSKYRGWNGSVADHNYNWHDAIHSGGGVCGANSPVPCDDDSHGTHTMGTMVGHDGGNNQIGMAPDAKWIGCRNMDQGVGTPATYAECFQWFVAPTDLAGQNPDPTKAPHVINNSWGCPPSEGCTNPLVLQTVVENVRNAGIVVVVSAGNSGSSCSTVADPPAIYDAAYSVGATNSSDTIASFSSRGPVTVDGSGRLKPDLSAPGVSVRSSVPTNSYATFSGTSMAGPHVAGGVALLLSALPSWKGQVAQIEQRLNATAFRGVTPTGQNCGGTPDNQFPNNTYGYGRLDIYAAIYEANLAVTLADSPDPVGIGSTLTYTATVSNLGPVAASGASLTVTLPASVTYSGASAVCARSGQTVTCALGNLAAGGSTQVQIWVVPNSVGTITATASVSSSVPDRETANNTANASTTVVGSSPDLAASLVASPNPVLRGTALTLTAGVANNGAGPATATVGTLTLPGTVAFLGAPAHCTASASAITCSFGTLPAGASAQANISVSPQAAGSVSFSWTVSSAESDANATDNATSAAADVVEAQPLALRVDDAGSGNGNGVLEPGELAGLVPTWGNPSAGNAAMTGTLLAFTGPGGASYSIVDPTADYGSIPAGGSASCGDCYQLLGTATTRPAAHWDAQVTEQLATGTTHTWVLHLGESFQDVPPSFWAYRHVESVFHAGISTGCAAQSFCPGSAVSRWQMAVFLARSLHPGPLPTSGTVPGMGDYSCTAGGVSLFLDVAPTDPGCKAIHFVAAQGVTTGCGGGAFCPDDLVSREQMAVFLARALVGDAVPVSGTVPGMGPYLCQQGGVSVFADVLPTDQVCRHVHYIASRQITLGCGGGNFCPQTLVSRDQMAVFLAKTFALALYGP